MIIAIDGPSGAGKSSVGKTLAERMNVAYLDTGAMYRAVAFLKLTHQLGDGDTEQLIKLVESSGLRFSFDHQQTTVYLNDENISMKIRKPEISQEASRLSALPPIRKLLVNMQRDICKNGNFVVEGRDIGSVVFPDTPFKFYLDAQVEERAQRRHLQLREQGIYQDIHKIADEIKIRDNRDSTRQDSPLKCTDDAIRVDSTNFSLDQVVETIISHINKKMKKNQ